MIAPIEFRGESQSVQHHAPLLEIKCVQICIHGLAPCVETGKLNAVFLPRLLLFEKQCSFLIEGAFLFGEFL